MKKYIKHLFLFAALTTTVVGCDTEAEFDIPEIKEVLLFEGFEGTVAGSGAVENAIALPGWSNFNVNPAGTRKWHSRSFSNNKYADFSSFFSVAGSSDEVWLVTPKVNLTASKDWLFNFQSKARSWTGKNLTVFISENYDGTQAGIATATWVELNPILPTAQVDDFVGSGDIDLNAYKGKDINIAFKYVGNKNAGTTTTFQLDNIKIFENK